MSASPLAKTASAISGVLILLLVMTGKETIDYNGSSIGAMVAELTDTNYISLATKFEFENGKAVISREIEGGEEVAETTLPLTLSCQKGMAEARIPNMRGIMAARTKPLKVVEASLHNATTSIKKFDTPPAKSGVKLVEAGNMDEMVRLLKEEAKVI